MSKWREKHASHRNIDDERAIKNDLESNSIYFEYIRQLQIQLQRLQRTNSNYNWNESIKIMKSQSKYVIYIIMECGVLHIFSMHNILEYYWNADFLNFFLKYFYAIRFVYIVYIHSISKKLFPEKYTGLGTCTGTENIKNGSYWMNERMDVKKVTEIQTRSKRLNGIRLSGYRKFWKPSETKWMFHSERKLKCNCPKLKWFVVVVDGINQMSWFDLIMS